MPDNRNPDREKRFQEYLEHSVPYFEKVRVDGDTPWFASEAERRELFFRRYRRPEPPPGMKPIESITSYQRKLTNDEPQQQNQAQAEHRRAA